MAHPSSRRTVLGGLAALPALTAPAVAAPGPDAALLALCSAFHEVDAAATEAWDAYDALADSPAGQIPEPPDALRRKGDFEHFFGYANSTIHPDFYSLSDAPYFREYRPPSTTISTRARLAASARAAEIVEALDAWSLAIDEHGASSGLHAAQQRADDLDERRRGIGKQIQATRPVTLEGFVAKAKVGAVLDWDQFDRSVLADLAAMGGQV